jgi:hypothetical protein
MITLLSLSLSRPPFFSRLSHTEPANLTTLSEQIQRKRKQYGSCAGRTDLPSCLSSQPLSQQWRVVERRPRRRPSQH